MVKSVPYSQIAPFQLHRLLSASSPNRMAQSGGSLQDVFGGLLSQATSGQALSGLPAFPALPSLDSITGFQGSKEPASLLEGWKQYAQTQGTFGSFDLEGQGRVNQGGTTQGPSSSSTSSSTSSSSTSWGYSSNQGVSSSSTAVSLSGSGPVSRPALTHSTTLQPKSGPALGLEANPFFRSASESVSGVFTRWEEIVCLQLYYCKPLVSLAPSLFSTISASHVSLALSTCFEERARPLSCMSLCHCVCLPLSHCLTACSVSKNVQDLPSNIHKTAAAMPSQRAVMHFAGLLGAGIFFMSLAFTIFLPIIAIAPQKFALCFTVGSSLAMGAFFALKGPAAQLESMLAADVSEPSVYLCLNP